MFGDQYVNSENAQEKTALAALTLTLSRSAGEETANPVFVATQT
jgi:hypothetical protein